jgi:putative transposase
MTEFNTSEPIGSIYENSFHTNSNQLGSLASKLGKPSKKLVNIICYCLNPNHFHFLLEQVAEKGVEKFLHRLGTGYTKYFNNKHKRSGALFQGTFKAVYVDSNEYLLHLSAYINLNNKVHKVEGSVFKSSLSEYETGTGGFCKKNIILEQFKSVNDYHEFIKDSLLSILENRAGDNIAKLLLE